MFEKLLYTISCFGKISFSKFDELLNVLMSHFHAPILGNFSFHRVSRNTLRYLESLGHCEIDYKNRNIFVCPTSLMLLPTLSLPKTVLVGSRTPALIERIKKYIDNNSKIMLMSSMRNFSGDSILPSTILIEAIDTDTIEDLAKSIHISSHVEESISWSILNFSTDLYAIIEELNFEAKEDINWGKREFSPSLLRFLDESDIQNKFKLAEYTSPIDQQKLHWLWRGDKAAEINRNWGRFLVLNSEDVNVIIYDKKKYLMSLPAILPLPRILAKAVTLCSGQIPILAYSGTKSMGGIPPKCPLYLFKLVPPIIADSLGKKLGQKILYEDIIIDNGVIK